MQVNFFKRRKILKKANFLDLTPFAMCEHVLTDEGKVNLRLPRFKNKFWQRFFVPKRKSPYFHIKFDENGSAVWLAMDGKRNVKAICDRVELERGDLIAPAIERVPKFLLSLYEQRYISFKELEKQ
jgi:hypothetical protein